MIKEFEAYNKKNIDTIRSNFKYEGFKYTTGSNTYTGGKLICKHCGKEFTWKDWGKGKSRALTLAMKHLEKQHNLPYFLFSPYLFREHNMFYIAFPEAKL